MDPLLIGYSDPSRILSGSDSIFDTGFKPLSSLNLLRIPMGHKLTLLAATLIRLLGLLLLTMAVTVSKDSKNDRADTAVSVSARKEVAKTGMARARAAGEQIFLGRS